MMDNVTIIRTLNSTWESKASYVDEWFLVGSPVQCFLILASYLAFVLKIGPYIMKDKEPYKLTQIILVYNLIQVIVSVYLFKLVLAILLKTGLILGECVFESEALQYEFYSAAHFYMLTKISELLDTVFFVLRKKYGQASFLHIYHHCAIFFYSWAIIAFKQSILSIGVLGLLNSFVHSIMYLYYALSVFTSIFKYLWWKKYLTSMQMIQFVLMIMYAVYEYLMSPCKFSSVLFVHIIFNVCLMLYLFARFYKNTYKSSQVKKEE